MRAPDFWWRRERSAAARLLSPLGALSGALTLARMRRKGVSPGVPVICVGNPTVGGAGKTPTVIHLARLLAAQGRHPAILTRGYGGSERGPLQVDASLHPASRIGDEPLLLARAAPTWVARDRIAGAGAAMGEGADILIMDDGFQNPSLAKTLSILVVDGGVGVGNGLSIPAGPLRAPLWTALGDLAGLPPALMFCGTRDTLAPGCRLLERRAAETDWDLAYVEVGGLIHVYPLLPLVPEARHAWARTLEFLR